MNILAAFWKRGWILCHFWHYQKWVRKVQNFTHAFLFFVLKMDDYSRGKKGWARTALPWVGQELGIITVNNVLWNFIIACWDTPCRFRFPQNYPLDHDSFASYLVVTLGKNLILLSIEILREKNIILRKTISNLVLLLIINCCLGSKWLALETGNTYHWLESGWW